MLTASGACTGQPKGGETKERVPRLRKRRNQRKVEDVMPVEGEDIDRYRQAIAGYVKIDRR
jgi:hypothetical protein